jgi:hypothetical protein
MSLYAQPSLLRQNSEVDLDVLVGGEAHLFCAFDTAFNLGHWIRSPGILMQEGSDQAFRPCNETQCVK